MTNRDLKYIQNLGELSETHILQIWIAYRKKNTDEKNNTDVKEQHKRKAGNSFFFFYYQNTRTT